MAAELAPRQRTAPELATLLLELGRLIRARRYYRPGDPRLVGVFEHSLRAWRADFERRGALAIELLAEGFRELGSRGVLSHPQLAQLQQDLAERGVRELRFETPLDGEAFAAFAEVLATDAGRTASRGGFATALYEHSPAGILVNGLAPPVSGVPPDASGASEPEGIRPGDSFELPSVGAALSSTDDIGEPTPTPDLEGLLRELEECEAAGRYPDLARRATLLAERAFDEGRPDECFRVALRLAAHVESKELPRLRDQAGSFLRSLMQGPRLEDLVARLTRALDSADLEASRVLLALGGAAVPALLDAAVSAEDSRERERLNAVLLTLVDVALPAVIERLRIGDTPARVRAAARIAGELQHPDAVAPLAALIGAPDRSIREEAIRALARVGSDASVDALAAALDAEGPGVGVVALHALGSTGSARAVPHLERALAKASELRDVARAKEAIRALGRLGRPEAAKTLVELLGRRVRLGAGWLRELKSAAVSALAAIPGDEAVAALAQAARARDVQLRRAAQTALDRRAQTRARVGA